MSRRRKAAQDTRPESLLFLAADYLKATNEPLHPDVGPLAILTALIDPEDVRQAELTHTIPKAFNTALHLIWKIDDFYNGRFDRLCSPEQLEDRKLLRRRLIERKWPLLEGDQFSLKEATMQRRWCEYKTVPNLQKFLKRNDYPVRHYFDGPPFITEAAYKKAQEAELERIRQCDRERKKATQAENRNRKITSNFRNKSRNFRVTPGTKRRTSGKLASTSGSP
jgi:hypothetical protein